jgi:hypothetical protein
MARVLSLFDYTGNMVKPWARAGYDCTCVDTQHHGLEVRDGIEYVGADVMSYLPPLDEYEIVFAFPPCTHLAVSGARWFGDKGLSALHEAIGLVERARKICEWTGAPYMIENPVSTLSTYWRPPDYTFDPCDYGGYFYPAIDRYTKRTCLWTGNGFLMPPPLRVEPEDGSAMHLLPPSEDRANLRSATPMGFAEAVWLANDYRNQEMSVLDELRAMYRDKGDQVYLKEDDLLICYDQEPMFRRAVIRIAVNREENLEEFEDLATKFLKSSGGYMIDKGIPDYWFRVKPTLIRNVFDEPEVRHKDGVTEAIFTELRVGEVAVNVTLCQDCHAEIPMEWAYSFNNQKCQDCASLPDDQQLSML